MEQNFFSTYQKPGLYTLTTSYNSPPDISSVPLAMGMAKEAGFKVYTLFPYKEDGYSVLGASLGSLSDYRQMDEHFSGMPSKALVYVPMEANNKVYASNGRRSFPCAGVFAIKKDAKGDDILVNYSLDGGLSDGSSSYVGQPPERPPKEERGEEKKEPRNIDEKMDYAIFLLEEAERNGLVNIPKGLQDFARGTILQRIKAYKMSSKTTIMDLFILLYLRRGDIYKRKFDDCSSLLSCVNKRGWSFKRLNESSFLKKGKGRYMFGLTEKGFKLLQRNYIGIDERIREAMANCKSKISYKKNPVVPISPLVQRGGELHKKVYKCETAWTYYNPEEVGELRSEVDLWWGKFKGWDGSDRPLEQCDPVPPMPCGEADTLHLEGGDGKKASFNVGGWVDNSHLDDEDKKDGKEIVAEVLKLKTLAPKYSSDVASVYQSFYRSIVTDQEAHIPDECLAKAKKLLEEAEGDGVDVAIPGRLIQYRPRQTELRFAEAAPQPEGETVDSDALEREVADLEEKARIMQDKAGKARIEDLKRRKKEAEDIIERSKEILRKLSLEA